MKIVEGLTETLRSKIRKFLDLETRIETQSKSKYYQIPYDSFGAPVLPGISDALKIDYDVMVRYADYDDMDDYPIISTAFDIYADDSCQIDLLKNSTVWGDSESSEIKKLINELLNNRLNIEDTIWELVRNLVKYGNDFEELLVSNRGVEGWVYVPTPLMRRVEQNRNLLGFVQDTTGNYMVGSTQYLESMLRFLSGDKSEYNFGNLVFFEPNEIQHFRLLSKQRSGVYGFGVGEPARWIFKRLVLLQDSMIMHKLTRATSRLVFYIDAGETNFIDAMKYADMVRQKYKRKKYVDPNTGKLDLRYNPLCLTLDTKIPLLDGRTETLQTLIDEYSQGKQNCVYSIDPETKQIHAGKIVWAGVTRRNAQLVRVTLDNGQQIRCTPDHKFMLKNGKYLDAQYLQSDMVLMSQNDRNCKVDKVEWLDEKEDTGCITVEPHHNFALDVGIFVKNSDDEDFFIPVVGGRETTRIDNLSGLDYQNIDVVEYFDKLLYSALKIPKSYLSFDEDVKGKAVLSMEDIRFARTVMRIQRILKTGLNRIVTLHLCLLGIDPNSVDYDIGMTVPSAILELAQLEAMNAKIDFASKFGDYVSSYWILSHIFGFTDNQIEKIYEQKAMDLYYNEKIEYDAKKRFDEYKEKMEIDKMSKQPKDGGEGGEDAGLEGEEGEEELGGEFVSFEDKGVDDKYHGWLFEKKLRRLKKEKNDKKRKISVDEIMDGVMKGNREFEKKLEDKLDDVLKENDDLRNRIERISGLMEELRLNIGGRRK